MEKDLIVIGGGPGGYEAAIRGAQLGANVALVEMDKVGGTCTNRGCIPTKALCRTAEVISNIEHAPGLGINVGSYTLDGQKINDRVESVVAQLRGGIEHLLNQYGIESINGKGSFVDKNTVRVTFADGTTRDITAKNIIIATGSVPSPSPVPGGELPGVMNSDDLLKLTTIPKSMVVLGGGVIAVEFAAIYAAFGTEVTILIRRPNLLAGIDSEIVKRFTPLIKKKGVKIQANTNIQSIEKTESGLVCKATDNKGNEVSIESETVLMALGRSAFMDGLGLENAGVEFTRKGIPADEYGRTNVDSIYAIGDVLGGMMLAHWASHQGITAVEHALGAPCHAGSESMVPGCIFTAPEIAAIGLTEDEAKETLGAGNYKVSKFPFVANGKSLALGETDGIVKFVADSEGKLLGAHIMGPHASDLLHEATLAIYKGMKASDLKEVIHAHPTLSETVYETAMGIDGIAIHQAPPRK